MSMIDACLLAVAGYVSWMVLVRLLRHERNQEVRKLRQEIELAQWKRRQAERLARKRERQAAAARMVLPETGPAED